MLTDPERYPLDRMLGMADLLGSQVDALAATGVR